jgi:hypothetical protein
MADHNRSGRYPRPYTQACIRFCDEVDVAARMLAQQPTRNETPMRADRPGRSKVIADYIPLAASIWSRSVRPALA